MRRSWHSEDKDNFLTLGIRGNIKRSMVSDNYSCIWTKCVWCLSLAFLGACLRPQISHDIVHLLGFSVAVLRNQLSSDMFPALRSPAYIIQIFPIALYLVPVGHCRQKHYMVRCSRVNVCIHLQTNKLYIHMLTRGEMPRTISNYPGTHAYILQQSHLYYLAWQCAKRPSRQLRHEVLSNWQLVRVQEWKEMNTKWTHSLHLLQFALIH